MKTFELTQEQIDRLAEKKHAKELLQEFLPEAFENKLEVGVEIFYNGKWEGIIKEEKPVTVNLSKSSWNGLFCSIVPATIP